MEDMKDVSDILRNLATVTGAILALIWFWTTRAYKRHVQVDLSCRAFPLDSPYEGTLVEIGVVIENKGTRRQKLAYLTIWVEYLESVEKIENEPPNRPVWRPLTKPKIISLHSEKRFMVLKGISQEFTHTLVVPPHIALIRVTSTFNFDKAVVSESGTLVIPYPAKRTARRIFDLRVKGTDKADSNMAAA